MDQLPDDVIIVIAGVLPKNKYAAVLERVCESFKETIRNKLTRINFGIVDFTDNILQTYKSAIDIEHNIICGENAVHMMASPPIYSYAFDEPQSRY